MDIRRRTFLLGTTTLAAQMVLPRMGWAQDQRSSTAFAAGPDPADDIPDWPYSILDQHFALPRGINSPNINLSANADGTVTLREPDDADDLQGWMVVPVPQVSGQFNIVAASPTSSARLYLGASPDGSRAELVPIDDGSGRQRWQFEAMPDRLHSSQFRTRIAGGVSSSRKYLSASADGGLIGLVESDDDSGRQRWEIRARTEITPDLLPQWDYQSSVDLPKYLAKNQYRSRIRLFAREVVIPRSFGWRSGLGMLPLDMRIDCYSLTVADGIEIILSGSYGPDDPVDAMNPLDIVSYCPTPNTPAENGLPGFDGGSLTINAIYMKHEGDKPVILRADGGRGGSGQHGYPGLPDQAGGNGGDGGAGGDGGSIVIRANRFRPFNTFVVNGRADGGRGGSEGDFGPGGKRSDRAEWARGGVPGNPGPTGARGQIVTEFTDKALVAMQEDGNFKASLRYRMHQALTAEIQTLVASGDTKVFLDNTYWLREMTGVLNYDDVAQRLDAMADVLFGDQSIWARIAANQTVTMRADTLRKEIGLLREPPPLDEKPTNHRDLVRHMLAMAARVGPLHGCWDLFVWGYGEIFDRLVEIANRLTHQPDQPEDAPIKLQDLFGPNSSAYWAYWPPETIAYTKKITPGDIDRLEHATANNRIRPMGDPILGSLEIAAGVFMVGAKVGEWLFGTSTSSDDLISQTMGKCVTEINAFQMQTQTFRERWRAQLADIRTARVELDKGNREQTDRERDVRRNTRRQRKRKKDRDRLPRLLGFSWVGILDSIEQVEDKDDKFIAVFDAFLDLGLTNPLQHALATALSNLIIPCFVTCEVDRRLAESLKPGEWHRILFDYTLLNGFNGSAEYFTIIPGFSKDRMNQAVQSTGLDIPLSYRNILPLEKSFASTLNALYGYQQVPLVPSPAPLKRTSAAVGGATAIETTQNVGQATFHTFTRGDGTPVLAYDLGVTGGARSLSQTTNDRKAALARNQTPLVISHWDKDHYIGIATGSLAVQRDCPIIGPSYGLKGPLIAGVLRAIASNGPGHLFLVGTQTDLFAMTDPIVGVSAARYRSMEQIALYQAPAGQPAVEIPQNVSFDLSTKPNPRPYDKNNFGSIVAVVRGRIKQQDVRLLLPGDTSYTYISPDLKPPTVPLTHIEATHHGSWRSILTAAGRRFGTPTDNDIPPAAGQATVVFSYGENNQHHINADNVRAHYANKGWTVQWLTARNSANGQITIPLQ